MILKFMPNLLNVVVKKQRSMELAHIGMLAMLKSHWKSKISLQAATLLLSPFPLLCRAYIQTITLINLLPVMLDA